MAQGDRRTFLKTGAAGLAALPLCIQRALALPAGGQTGTLMDVEHVVILMQENRSFDHYFGMLRGVRGFGDPRPLTLASGKPVWHQPGPGGETVTPFRLDSATTAAQSLASLDHSWKGSQARWKNHDAWIAAKTPMTMGHFAREDLPFYYALADAFTICDAYHCSLFGPTNPNRLFLFSGTSGLAVGNDGPQVIQNPPDEPNETADPKNDAAAFSPYRWTTYAERLQAAGIDWRLYQEYDNYGDNGLAYFANFRGTPSELLERGRSWPATSNPANAKTSRGEHLIARFSDDVASGKLPQVSWIVAPTILCEHPAACPAYGEQFTARLIAALTAHPEVWARTVFILNYDENDGFFDHVPPPVPPAQAGLGKSTVALTGESYHGEPVGLGPRVPLLIVSPWTKGGYVNSELFDHTSVIRFLERRFGVMEPNITPWRRAVCGDLTSAFDFTTGGDGNVALPDTAGYDAKADAAHLLPPVVRPLDAGLPVQEAGQRPARALPYALEVTGRAEAQAFALRIANRGGAGASLSVHARDGNVWYYTVEAGKSLSDQLPIDDGGFAFAVHGPNGFLREFSGTAAASAAIETRYDAADQSLVLRIRNTSATACAITTAPRAYSSEPPRHYQLAPGAAQEDRWPLAASDHWYDLETRCGDAVWRFAGHVETDRPSRSDPAIGRA